MVCARDGRYSNQQRRRINNSPPLKMTIPEAAIQGAKRGQLPVDVRNENPMALSNAYP